MLSLTSKLGCHSWSLQAWDTCPGSRDSKGDAVDACKFCYARTGFYHMPDVKAVRERNFEDWRSPDWVDRMVAALSKQDYFRWFDSGDMFHIKTLLPLSLTEISRLTLMFAQPISRVASA
jgi:hypothetical protein